MTTSGRANPGDVGLDRLRSELARLRDAHDALNRRHESLLEDRQRYRFLYDESSAVNAVVTSDGTLLDVGRHFAESLGYTKEELLGRSAFDFLPEEDRPGARDHLARANAGEPIPALEVDIRGRHEYRTILLSRGHVEVREGDQRVGFLISGVDITERKRAEEELRRSQALLQLILHHSNDGINVSELDVNTGKRRLILCNDRYVEMTGRTREELAASDNLRDLAVMAPDTQPRSAEDYLAGRPTSGVASWRRPDGRENYFEWRASGLRDGDRVIVVGVDRDITQHRRAESALRERELQYRTIFASAAAAFFVLTPGGVIVDCNPEASRLYGYDHEELVGMSMTRLLHPDVLPERRALLARGPSALPFHGESRNLRKNGSVVDVEVHASTFEFRGAPHILAVLRDITERKAAERALRQSQELLRLILQHSRDGISISELDLRTGRRRLVTCNDRYAEMAGRSREDLLALPDLGAAWTILSPSPRSLRRGFLAGEAVSGVSSWLRPDGRENYCEWSATGIPDGERVRIVSVDRDVTHRRRQEQLLREAHRQLMTAREEERRRLARELHDSIGQSLVALQLEVKSLLIDAGPGDAGRSTAALQDVAQRCGGLIHEVRAICHGLYPPTLESLGLPAALRELARGCGGCDVRFECAERVDGQRFPLEVEIALFRVAQQAVQNALQHSGSRRVRIRLSRHHGRVCLSVSDNGAGFDPEHSQGRGLGLRTMQERAQGIGGRLVIDSRPGRTRVELRLPEGLLGAQQD